MKPTAMSPARRAFVLTVSAALAVFAGAARVQAQDNVDPVDPIEDKALREEAAAKFEEALQTFEKAFETAISEAAAGGPAREKNLARAEVLLEKIDTLTETTTKHAETEKFLKQYADDAKTGPLLRAHVEWRRARFLLAEGDRAGAGEAIANLSLARDWWVIGPFDNERGQGFKKAESVEKKIDLGATLKGKDQHDVSWRQIPVKDILGYVDLDALVRPNDQAMAYAAAFVNSPEDRDAALRIGSDEAVVAWCNGKKVLSRDVRRGIEFDQDVAGIRLAKGWNVILLKVCDQTGAWGFRARLTTPDGAPLNDLKFAANREEADAAIAAMPKAADGDVTAASGAKSYYDAATKEKKSARDLFHLGLLHYEREFDSHADRKAENILKEASEAEPTNAIYRFHYAEAAAPPAESVVDREDNRQRQGREKALELDPSYAVACRALASYYSGSLRNYERAEDLLRKALAVNENYFEARLDLANVLQQRGLTAQGEIERRRALSDSRAATNETLARTKAQLADQRGMGREAIDAWKEVLRLDARGNDVRRRMAELAAQAMSADEAIGLFDAIAELSPFDVSVLRRKAQMLVGREDLDGAVKVLERALEIAPQDDELLADLGEVQLRQGARDAALKNFRKSLALNEKNAQLERYVEYLDPDAAPYEDDFAVSAEGLKPLLEKAAAWKNEENDGWLVVLDQTVTKVNRDGTSSRYVRGVVRILNDAGVKNFDRVFAQGWGQLKWKWARVHRADGSVVDAKMQGQMADLVSLKAGDVVDWAYRFDDREQSYFGDYFGDSAYFADYVPVLESRYTLLTPAEREFYFHQKNFDAKPEVAMRDEGKTRVYTWRNADVAKIRFEPMMPDMREAAPQVQVTTYKDWDAFAAWWAALIKDQKIVTDEMKAKVAELTKDKESRFDKIRAIYDFVTGEVTYQAWEFGVHGYKPYTTTQIFEKREGDCKDKAILACALLGEIGVEAHPVLIYADQGRSKDDLTLPLVQQFNHCIAYVPDVDGKGTEMFLDGTAQYHTASAPPAMDRGATVLIVKPDGAEIKRIGDGTPDDFGVDQEWNVVVKDDGSAVLNGTFRWRGDMATQARGMFSVEGQRPLILQSLLNRTFGNMKLVKHEFTDLKDLSKPVAEFKVEVSVPSFAKKSGDSYTLPAGFFDLPKLMGLTRMGALADRKQDLILPVPLSAFRVKARYELPAGWTVESEPEDTKGSIPAGSYSVQADVAGNVVTYERVLEVTGTRVAPADYPAFREGLTKVAAVSDQNFKVHKSAAPVPEGPAAVPTTPAQPETPAPEKK